MTFEFPPREKKCYWREPGWDEGEDVRANEQ